MKTPKMPSAEKPRAKTWALVRDQRQEHGAIALIVGVTDSMALVLKYQRRSHGFSAPRWVPHRDVIGKPNAKDADLHAAKGVRKAFEIEFRADVLAEKERGPR